MVVCVDLVTADAPLLSMAVDELGNPLPVKGTCYFYYFITVKCHWTVRVAFGFVIHVVLPLQ